jgi:hypothetical protein
MVPRGEVMAFIQARAAALVIFPLLFAADGQ